MIDSILQTIQTHEDLFFWSAVFSVVTFIGSLIVVPVLVAKIPVDYFSHERRERTEWAEHHPVIRMLLLIAKNLFGYVLLLMGIAMLVLPGQGLLTIMIGLMLINFPGKYRLERWLVSCKPILKSINWLREKSGHEPLRLSD